MDNNKFMEETNMPYNIQSVVEDIADVALGELQSLFEDWYKKNEVSPETTEKRIERWHDRTIHKLLPYLVDFEVVKFNSILRGSFIPNQSVKIDEQIKDIVKKYREYFVEFGDDLHSTPHKVIKGVPDEFASAFINVFISYAWANDGVVLAIDQWLRNKGIKTKIDKRDFFAGSRIRDEIIRVMSECKVILLFHSHQSKDKPWIEFEHELASDIEMSLKIQKKETPRIIYIVIDDTPLPNISAQNRIAIMAKGKRFDLVCEEIYHNILQLPKDMPEIDLSKWESYTF